MNFTFDGNIYENNNSSKDFKSDQKFNFSGLIYESNIRTAKTPLPFEADVRKFLALNPIERTNYLIDVLGKRSQSEREEFTKTWSILDKKSSDSSLDPEKLIT